MQVGQGLEGLVQRRRSRGRRRQRAPLEPCRIDAHGPARIPPSRKVGRPRRRKQARNGTVERNRRDGAAQQIPGTRRQLDALEIGGKLRAAFAGENAPGCSLDGHGSERRFERDLPCFPDRVVSRRQLHGEQRRACLSAHGKRARGQGLLSGRKQPEAAWRPRLYRNVHLVGCEQPARSGNSKSRHSHAAGERPAREFRRVARHAHALGALRLDPSTPTGRDLPRQQPPANAMHNEHGNHGRNGQNPAPHGSVCHGGTAGPICPVIHTVPSLDDVGSWKEAT